MDDINNKENQINHLQKDNNWITCEEIYGTPKGTCSKKSWCLVRTSYLFSLHYLETPLHMLLSRVHNTLYCLKKGVSLFLKLLATRTTNLRAVWRRLSAITINYSSISTVFIHLAFHYIITPDVFVFLGYLRYFSDEASKAHGRAFLSRMF